jgi:hypothetical protein
LCGSAGIVQGATSLHKEMKITYLAAIGYLSIMLCGLWLMMDRNSLFSGWTERHPVLAIAMWIGVGVFLISVSGLGN